MKRHRYENPNATHKRPKIEEVEVPKDLQDLHIPREDMGNVIVLTRL